MWVPGYSGTRLLFALATRTTRAWFALAFLDPSEWTIPSSQCLTVFVTVTVAHDDNLDPVPDWNLGVLAGAGGLFEVTTRDGRLYVQRSGQSPLRAFPMSEWRFFHKAVNAQLTFEPGGDSYAARLVLHQSGSDQT
jgi:hypothetical protein